MVAEASREPLYVLAPVGRDAEVVAGMLRGAGLAAETIADFDLDETAYEAGAGLIVAEEAFARLDPRALHEWLSHQPPWSDYPIVLLRMRGAPVTPETAAFIEGLGKVTILERPLHPITLIAAARSALRARSRQRETEALMVERMRTAQVLRESEARFRTMADSAPALIWMSDEKGDVLYANRCHEAVFGRPADSFLGEGWRQVLHPDDAERVVEAFVGAARAGEAVQIEFRVIDHEGAVRWLRCEAAPRALDGQAGHVGCGVDITEAKLAADQLERRIQARTAELAAANHRLIGEIDERERMEAALRRVQRLEAVGQLTAGVAHDFNNLLSVLMGGVEFLERSVAEPRDKRRLEMMRIAAERGAKLTSQLLAFSRRQKLEPKVVNLNEAVLGMRDLLQSTIGGGYDLRIKLAARPWRAMVDPTQMEMVILNLAINARDAMEVGGSLTVQTGNVTVTAPKERPEEPEPGEYVMVCVSDTGTGMAPHVLERVFEPFYTTKPVGRGSGLGLSQVLGFAEQSGGGVRIETELGKGTSVQVFLPRARSAPDAPRPSLLADGLNATRKGGMILLVDDDDMVRENTALMLRDLGFEVVEAASGARALDILAGEQRLDLMLVDFAMPGMNGADVARAAAGHRPALPILFVTGYADLGALKNVDERRILPKPFDEKALAERLAAALEGGGPASA
jgi:PAS domain S-box-containing protein